MPFIMQGFIGKPAEVEKDWTLTAVCMWYVVVFEQSNDDTYVVSMSSRTIVYKGYVFGKGAASVL